MSPAWSESKALIHRALEGQGFRAVALDELVAAPFRLPGVGGDVDAALRSVAQDPNWVEVTRQLAQLRTRAFAGLHLRRDEHDLEIVPIYAWSGRLRLATLEEHRDWAFTVTKHLAGWLGKFELPDDVVSPLVGAASAAAGGTVASSVISAIVDLNEAAVPNTTLLAVDTDGLDAEISQRLDAGEMARQDDNPLKVNKARVYVAAIDGTDLSVHGHNDLASLNLPELGRSLQFLLRNA